MDICRFKLLFFAGIILISQNVYPRLLPVNTKYAIIVDTDCGIDDFRALSMLLCYSPYAIKAVTISSGNVLPENGQVKVCSLLKNAGIDSFPIGIGQSLHSHQPEWRAFNEMISWGKNEDCDDRYYTSLELLNIVFTENDKVTLIALGPLTNVAELIENNPGAAKIIDRIIWYNEGLASGEGFNYLYDSNSAKTVLNAGVRVDIISNLNRPGMVMDFSFLTGSPVRHSALYSLLHDFYKENDIPEERFENQSVLRDELAVLYFTNPELFNMNTVGGNRSVRECTGFDQAGIKEAVFDMVNGLYSDEPHIVFNRFPSSREMFNYDVRRLMDSAIAVHGPDEWKACVITSELHGHLGIYSIIGAKMGILARELLGSETGTIQVISYAGNNPPNSCLNDGLQVSTGATLGMNLISVTGDNSPEIMANFSSKGNSLTIRLKREYAERIESDIMEGIVKYGLQDDGYWKLVRQVALKYWMEWEREKIFDVEITRK